MSKSAEAITQGMMYGKLYARLDSMRLLCQEALCESSPPLEVRDHERLVHLRDNINSVIGMVIDSSRRDAARCK